MLIFSLCTLNHELNLGGVRSHVRQLGSLSSYCHAAVLVIGRHCEIKETKDAELRGRNLCMCIFSHTVFEAETSAESHKQLSSAIPHRAAKQLCFPL